MTLLSPIVALGVTDQSIVALTSTYPVLVTGSSPDAMAPHVRPAPQACVNARGVASLGAGVLFPSHDGLCMVAAGEVRVMTRDILTRGQWQAMRPDKLFAVVHDDKYFGFTRDAAGEPAGAFVFDPLGGQNMLRDIGVSGTAAWSEPESDGLYLAMKVGGYNRVMRFDEGESLRMSWRSKRFFISVRDNLTAARIEGDYPPCPGRAAVAVARAENLRREREAKAAHPVYVAAVEAWNASKEGLPAPATGVLAAQPLASAALAGGAWPVTPVPAYAAPPLVPVPSVPEGVRFELYADGEKRFEKDVSRPEPFRLPGGYAGKTVEFAVSSRTSAIERVELATSVTELAL